MSSNSTVPVRMPCGVPGKACYIVWKTQFLVDDRYQLTRALGRGAYGIVVAAKDTISGQKVAIKKISAVFENPIVAWRTLREVSCRLRVWAAAEYKGRCGSSWLIG